MRPWMKGAFALALLGAAGPALAAGAEGTFEKPDQVTIQTSALGRVVADAKGGTLYFFRSDQQTPGKSTCVAACATAWPPLIAPAGAKPVGDWTVITRPEGTSQWAYKGKPVYTFQADHKPGDVTGEGAQLAWTVVHYTPPAPPVVRPGVVSLQLVGEAYVLADSRGMTLYQTDKDPPGASNCDETCARTWRPLEVAGLGHPLGDWTIVTRPDGAGQWAYKGRPVYLYDGDGKVGAKDGDGADGGWRVALP